MRIACLAHVRIPSRTANSIQVMKVCQALTECGHTLCLWVPALMPPTAWPELADHYGLRTEFEIRRISEIPLLRRYSFSLGGVRAAQAWHADLAYTWPYPAAALASWLGMPTLLELHDRPGGIFGPLWLRGFLRGRGARRIAFTTQALHDEVAASYPIPPDPSFGVLARNGVDLERYRDLPSPPEARAALGLPERFTAAYTGHLYAGRGVSILIELARRNPGMGFVIAGGEAEAVSEWHRQARSAGADNIHFSGFVDNRRLPLYQASAEVLLLPHERRVLDSGGGDIARYASPMKVFDYMAAGRAILASDLPVLREVLHEGIAILLPAQDVEAWDAALRRIASEAQARAQLGSAARREVARYTWVERARRCLEGLEAAR